MVFLSEERTRMPSYNLTKCTRTSYRFNVFTKTWARIYQYPTLPVRKVG